MLSAEAGGGMGKIELLTVHLFRTEPGDLRMRSIAVVPGSGTKPTRAIKAASECLENYFSERARTSQEQPTQARLVGENGRVIAEFRMTPEGARRVDA